MEPLAQFVSLLRPQTVLWQRLDATGRWGLFFKPTADMIVCTALGGECLLLRDGRLLFTNKSGRVVFALGENGDVAVAGRITQQAGAAALDGAAVRPR